MNRNQCCLLLAALAIAGFCTPPAAAQDAGRKYITVASRILAKESS